MDSDLEALKIQTQNLKRNTDQAIDKACNSSKFSHVYTDKSCSEHHEIFKREILEQWNDVISGDSDKSLQQIVDELGMKIHKGISSGEYFLLPKTRFLLKVDPTFGDENMKESIEQAIAKHQTWKCYGMQKNYNALYAEVVAMVKKGIDAEKAVENVAAICSKAERFVELPETKKKFLFQMYMTSYDSNYSVGDRGAGYY